MKKRLTAVLCAMAVFFTILPSVFAANTDKLYSNWTEAANDAKEGTDYTIRNEWAIINTAKGLAYVSQKINDGTWTMGMNIQLGRDIDLSGVVDDSTLTAGNSWIPIGNTRNPFGNFGTATLFNGNGHTVKGLKIYKGTSDYNGMYQGLFGKLNKAVIMDIHVTDSQITVGSGISAGGIAGLSTTLATVNDCSFDGTIKGDTNIGGIGGEFYGQVENCTFKGTVTGKLHTGGIVGYNEYTNTIVNCLNEGTVAGQTNVGGIAGCTWSVVTGSENKGNVYGYNNVGGIVGLNAGYGRYASSASRQEQRISGCSNSGRISTEPFEGVDLTTAASVGCIGGIAGSCNGTVENCHNSGAVILKAYDDKTISGCAGIVTYAKLIKDCSNSGNIINEGNNSAGIVATMEGNEIVNCSNTGNVSALNNAAGIVAYASKGVANSYNTGTVTASGNKAGGIAAESYAFAGFNAPDEDEKEIALINCYNSGEVISSTGGDPFIGYKTQNSSEILNSYYLDESGDENTFNANGVLKDGSELYAKLNTNLQDGWKRWQKGGSAPAIFEQTTEEPQIDNDLYASWTDAGNDAEADADYKIEDNATTIYTAKGLAWLANTVNGGNDFKGKTILLAEDIDLNGIVDDAALNSATSWNPIGTLENPFKGTFDGQNHTITGMKIKRGASNQGLFGCFIGGSLSEYLKGNPSAEIKNLKIDNSSICIYAENADAKYGNVGAVIGVASGNIVNVATGKNVLVTGNGAIKSNLGGIIGRDTFGEVRNCRNEGKVGFSCYGYINSVGCIIGSSSAYLVDHCSNSGQLGWGYKKGGSAGGIMGTLISSSSAVDTYVTNCWNEGAVTGSGAGGIAGYYYGDNGYIINCYNVGQVTSYTIAGGGIASYGGNVHIENCYNSGIVNKPANISETVPIGGAIGKISDGENNIIKNFYNRKVQFSAADEAVGVVSDSAKTDINSKEFDISNQVTDEKLYELMNENLEDTSRDGLLKWAETDWVTHLTDEVYIKEGYQGKTETGLYKTWRGAGEEAVKGVDYDTSDDITYTISTAKGLAWLANQINYNTLPASRTFVLTNDINLSGVVDDTNLTAKNSWIPIGNVKKDTDNPFVGTFDGQGHTISGIKIKSDEMYQGLFGQAGSGSKIKNLNVASSELHLAGETADNDFVATAYGGAIAGSNSGHITNCTSSADIYGSYAGGIAGISTGGMIVDCTNRSNITGVSNLGGIAGCGTGKISSCVNEGSITGDNAIGGICGESINPNISLCENKGTVTGYLWIGGIAGIANSKTTSVIFDCRNSGKIINQYSENSFIGLAGSGDFGRAGGIVGAATNVSITRCQNTGDVVSPISHDQTADAIYCSNFGGIAGYCENQSKNYEMEIKGCTNSGNINIAEDCAGGIVGNISSPSNAKNIKLINCVNNGNVTVNNMGGGIAGNNGGGVIHNSYSAGNVSGQGTSVGGICGENTKPYNDAEFKAEINNCYTVSEKVIGRNGGDMVKNSYATTSATLPDGTPLYRQLNTNLISSGETSWTHWVPSENLPAEFGELYFTWREAGDAAVKNKDYSAEGSIYTIYTPAGLAWLANRVDSGRSFVGETVLLGNDINLTGVVEDCVLNNETSWNPIGETNALVFKGHFDGQNHKISGMQISTQGLSYQALFSEISNEAVVENLTLSNSTVTIIPDATNHSRDQHIAGIAGLNRGIIRNCKTDSSVKIKGAYVGGGIVGAHGADATIENCVNEAQVINGESSDTTNNSANYLGGIAGTSSGNITGCINRGFIGGDSTQYAGGIAGIFHQNSNENEAVIINCANEGEISSIRAAGIAAFTGGNSASILNSYNRGNVTGNISAGGISVGGRTCARIYNCYNSGIISGDKNGGIAAEAASTADIKDCYYASYSAPGAIGGLNDGENGLYMFNDEGIIIDKQIPLYKQLNNNLHSISNQRALTWIDDNGLATFSDVNAIDLEITGISIAAAPRTSYIEGQTFEPSGLVITVKYSNDSETNVDYDTQLKDKVTFSPAIGAPLATTDTQVTVSYMDKTAQLPISVVNKDVTNIEITSLPNKTEYIEGEDINPEGITVTAFYNNGTSAQVNTYDVTGYDRNKVGTQTVTVTYGDKQAEFNVVVREKSVTGIRIVSSPTKTDYIEGTALNSAGLIVEANYDNGTKEIITNYSLSGFDSGNVGKCDVTVTYKEFTDKFTVNIAEKSVTGIELDSSKAKTNYIEGQELDTTALIVYRLYDNGTKDVTEDYQTVGYNPNEKGTQTVTVKYDTFSASYDVKVVDKTLSSIAIVSPPLKTSYIEGQELDLEGLAVTGKYDNNTSTFVDGYDVTGYDKNKIGAQTITVTYGGKTAEFEVTVQEKALAYITVSGMKTEYIEGNDLDTSGLIVTKVYDNGTTSTAVDFTISGYDKTVIGTQTITVTCDNKTAEFDVNVSQKSLTGIRLDTSGAKLNYIEGLNLDTTGLKVYALYNNGTEEEVNNYDISNYNGNTVGKQTLTVTYSGFKAEYDVTVVDKSLESIEIQAYPSKTEYTEGEELDLGGLIVLARYNNNTSTTVRDYDITGYMKNIVGEQTVTITYGGKTAEFNVNVKNKSVKSIFIAASPIKTKYVEGEQLNTAGLKVCAVYDNGTIDEIQDYSLGEFDSATVGTHSITVTYEDKTAAFEVCVVRKTMTGILIDKTNVKTSYLLGEHLNTDGLQVYALYDNNTAEAVINYRVGGYDRFVLGRQAVTVTYNGFVAWYDVTVHIRNLFSIEILSYPDKTEYVEGDNLNLDGLVVQANYDDDTTAEIKDYTVSGFESNESGKKTITIAFGDQTARFDVTVSEQALTDPKPALQATASLGDNKANVSFTAENCGNGVVIAALYSGDVLVGMQTVNYETANPVNNIEVPYTQTPDKIRVMMWKNFDNLVPACDGIDITNFTD